MGWLVAVAGLRIVAGLPMPDRPPQNHRIRAGVEPHRPPGSSPCVGAGVPHHL